MFIAEMVLFTIFLAGFTISPSLPVLLACLLGMGMALGCDYPTAHLMLSETMPTSSRSRTVLGAFAFQAVGAVAGATLAVVVLSMPNASVSSWRVMFGLVVLPAALVTVGRFFTPQSPHWLLTRGGLRRPRTHSPASFKSGVRSRQACGWMPSQPVNEYRKATLTCSDMMGRYGRRFLLRRLGSFRIYLPTESVSSHPSSLPPRLVTHLPRPQMRKIRCRVLSATVWWELRVRDD